MSALNWELDYRRSDDLPPLAWVARVTPPRIEVVCGTSVKCEEQAFFEGTWAGPDELALIPKQTTVFGSGMAISGTDLMIVPPSHCLEGVYISSRPGALVASNSLVGLLSATGLELDPAADYPGRYVRIIDGIGHSPLELSTAAGPIWYAYYENVLVGADVSWTVSPKPRESPFVSFAEYRGRLSAALGSCLANAADRDPVVAMSSGYDSTAAAVIAAEHGVRRVLTLATGKPVRGEAAPNDSGAVNAGRLGMSVTVMERLDYQSRSALPEAEFLATGMTGEDVVLAAMETALRGALLVSGVGGGIWYRQRPPRDDLTRFDLQGCSLGEFRLRSDFVHVPLPLIGGTQQPSLHDIVNSEEMQAYSVGGEYDSPIPRRIAEEAGLPRGTFATRNLATSATIHSQGDVALSPATRRAVQQFAAAEGREMAFPRPFRLTRAHRLLIRLAKGMRAQRLVAGLERRRRRLVHFEPRFGNLLLRWAVSVVRPRYESVAGLEPPPIAPPAGNGETRRDH